MNGQTFKLTLAGLALVLMILIFAATAHCQTIPPGCKVNPDGASYTCPIPKPAPAVVPPAPAPTAEPIPVITVPVPVSTPTTTELPPNFYAAGAGWNQYAHPQINGWASMAHLISTPGVGIYSYSTYDVTSRTARPFTIQTSTRTGFATLVRRYGPVSIFGLGDAGVALSGTNLGVAFSGGGVGVIKIGKSAWCVVLGARVLKTAISSTQTIYEAGIGRSF